VKRLSVYSLTGESELMVIYTQELHGITIILLSLAHFGKMIQALLTYQLRNQTIKKNKLQLSRKRTKRIIISHALDIMASGNRISDKFCTEKFSNLISV
jgi:hypothetical protein